MYPPYWECGDTSAYSENGMNETEPIHIASWNVHICMLLKIIAMLQYVTIGNWPM